MLSAMTYAGRRFAGVELFAGEALFFGATARGPNGARHLSYKWHWDDGTVGCVAIPAWACRGASIAHIYPKHGNYTVALTVVDRAGKRVSGQIPITIHPHPRWTVFSAARGLGSSVVTRSRPRGVLASTLILPSRATSVVAVIRIAGCGDPNGCVSGAHQAQLGRVTQRNAGPGLLRLLVRPSNRRLLRDIRMPLHNAHKHRLSATCTITVKLADRTPVRIVQHITLRF